MKHKKRFLILMFLFIFSSCNFSADFGKEDTQKSEISGVVVKKYREPMNHNLPCIDLNNDVSIGIEPWDRRTDLWEYIEIGDSVYKPSGTLTLKVIKPTGETKEFIYDYE